MLAPKNIKNIGALLVLFSLVFWSISCGKITSEAPIEKVDLTLEELDYYDGKEGRPAYVAINGDIYDLTKCRNWKNGAHRHSKGTAIAGRDLTTELGNSRHGMKRLKRYPIVGRLVESK